MIKWVAAVIGYSFLRFPGAILGFVIGGFLEFLSKNTIQIRTSSFAIKPEIFQLNLLALSALIIKADGKVQKKELDFVRSFFIGQYGKERADSIFKTFNTQIKNETQHLDQLTQVFVQQTAYETRLQILHFLFGRHKRIFLLFLVHEICNQLHPTYLDFVFVRSTQHEILFR